MPTEQQTVCLHTESVPTEQHCTLPNLPLPNQLYLDGSSCALCRAQRNGKPVQCVWNLTVIMMPLEYSPVGEYYPVQLCNVHVCTGTAAYTCA